MENSRLLDLSAFELKVREMIRKVRGESHRARVSRGGPPQR